VFELIIRRTGCVPSAWWHAVDTRTELDEHYRIGDRTERFTGLKFPRGANDDETGALTKMDRR